MGIANPTFAAARSRRLLWVCCFSPEAKTQPLPCCFQPTISSLFPAVPGPSGGMGPSDATCLPLPVRTGTLATGCGGILMAHVGLGCGADPHLLLLLGCCHITSSALVQWQLRHHSPLATPSSSLAPLAQGFVTVPRGDVLGVMKVTGVVQDRTHSARLPLGPTPTSPQPRSTHGCSPRPRASLANERVMKATLPIGMNHPPGCSLLGFGCRFDSLVSLALEMIFHNTSSYTRNETSAGL